MTVELHSHIPVLVLSLLFIQLHLETGDWNYNTVKATALPRVLARTILSYATFLGLEGVHLQ